MNTLQRLRLTFARGEEVKYISHLDLMRLWERALCRAGLPLAYSGGYTPHARISLAAPLAIGVTSEAELADIVLERRTSLLRFMRSLDKGLPKGIDLLETQEIGLGAPSLQSQVRFAEYLVTLESGRTPEEVRDAVKRLLALESLPWQHARDKEVRQYDLRTLIDDVWLEDHREGCVVLGMRLQTSPRGTGRPEQVAIALSLGEEPPLSIHRTRLVLADEL